MRRLVRYKIYFDRARTYISYVQFMGTVFIIVKLLRNGPIKTMIFDYWYLSFPFIFILFTGACVILGFVESRFAIRELEQENYSVINPEWQKLVEKIDKLLEKP